MARDSRSILEAGYAVVATVAGVPINCVTIAPGTGPLGEALLEHARGRKRIRQTVARRQQREKDAIMCFAGPAAVEVLAPSDCERPGRDQCSAASLLRELAGSDEEMAAYEARLWERALRLVSLAPPGLGEVILDVAQRLEARTTVTGADVVAQIRAVREFVPFSSSGRNGTLISRTPTVYADWERLPPEK